CPRAGARSDRERKVQRLRPQGRGRAEGEGLPGDWRLSPGKDRRQDPRGPAGEGPIHAGHWRQGAVGQHRGRARPRRRRPGRHAAGPVPATAGAGGAREEDQGVIGWREGTLWSRGRETQNGHSERLIGRFTVIVGWVARPSVLRGRAEASTTSPTSVERRRGLGPWYHLGKMDCAALLSLRNESTLCPIRGFVMPAQNALRIGCPHGATHFQPDGSRSLQTERGGVAREELPASLRSAWAS